MDASRCTDCGHKFRTEEFRWVCVEGNYCDFCWDIGDYEFEIFDATYTQGEEDDD
jgi:hypothetical protein